MTQEEALELLKMGNNCFIGGSAGSGKTYLLQSYIKWLNQKSIPVAITASTGIAATHINGQTIHSWSGLGARSYISDYDLESLTEKKYLHGRFENTKVLIIDEISMLSAETLDSIDKICRKMTRNENPFGGMQVVFSGDFFQLPPISKDGIRFAYGARAWREADIKICFLESQWRGQDADLIDILEAIRRQDLNDKHQTLLLDKLENEELLEIEPVKLFTHNIDVDAANLRELDKIKGKEKEYHSIYKGNKRLAESIERGSLIQPILRLKIGAKVMFIKNNFDQNIANGTLGQVVDFKTDGKPVVNLSDGRDIEVEPATWSIEEDGKVKAEVSQFPLRLAWAITIHKSQGMTLESAEVDLSKSFAPGMGYVALSRVRSLNGLKLVGFSDRALSISEEAFDFEKEAKQSSKMLREALSLMKKEAKEKVKKRFVEAFAHFKEVKLSAHEKTALLLGDNLTLVDIAKKREVKPETIVTHLEKLKQSDKLPDISHLKPAPNRLNVIKKVVKEVGSDKLTPIKNKLPKDYSYLEIRLARLFL